MRLFSKPKKLYKYLSTEGAQKLFSSSRPSLWFRLPNKLNDVFDLRPVGSYVDGFGSIAVLCLSETPTSVPMWAHYGSGGQGMVLEFDVNSEFFRQYPPIKVRYRSKRPTVANPRDAATAKSKEWAYEREWRCFTLLPTQQSESEQFLLAQQAVSVPFPFDALSAIIHGYDCAVDVRALRSNPNAQHVQELVCRIDPWTYSLNLRTPDDLTHIFENREAFDWGRRQR